MRFKLYLVPIFMMGKPKLRYFILHKPVNMVSQFVSSDDVRLLGDIDFDFPEGTHAVGRLDNHSEGLLILTTDKSITKRLFQGAIPHTRQYLVQVKNTISLETIEKLRAGVSIRIKGGAFYTTTSCEVEKVDNPFDYVLEKLPVYSYQASSWLMITLTEGKFHQVRKMVDAVGHKCVRLIRVAIEQIKLGDLPPGAVMEMDKHTFFEQLRIPN